MQVNVGGGAPSTRLARIIISRHDPAPLRPHVLTHEGSVRCGLQIPADTLRSRTPPSLPSVTGPIYWLPGHCTGQVSFWKIGYGLPSVMEMCIVPNLGAIHCPFPSIPCSEICLSSNSQRKAHPELINPTLVLAPLHFLPFPVVSPLS